MQDLLGVHSLSLEHETRTNVLAKFGRELANFKREFAEFKRKLAVLSQLYPAMTNFTREIAGINLQF